MTNQDGQPAATMPYVGVASFLKLPLGSPCRAEHLDFAVLGIPYDEAVSNRPGARSILEGARVADVGDSAILPLGGDANREAIAAAVRSLLQAGAFPVCLGGDHSISASILRAFQTGALPRLEGPAQAKTALAQGPPQAPPYLVHLDSHMDFDSYLPRHAHGTPVRIALEEGLVAGVLQVGVRGLNNGRDDWEEARRLGVQVVTAVELLAGGPEAALRLLPPAASLYVSVDIDVFDPAVAPGTGTPEPGGLDFRQVGSLLRQLTLSHRIVGLDLVEVNPLFDHGEITAVLAARLLLDFMGHIWQASRTR
jgi:agmatinase